MNIITYLTIKLIRIYKFLMSPFLGHNCRFLPTCSDYSIEALQTYGFFKGLYMSFKRIFSCHPWNDGGYDPVKKEMKFKK